MKIFSGEAMRSAAVFNPLVSFIAEPGAQEQKTTFPEKSLQIGVILHQ